MTATPTLPAPATPRPAAPRRGNRGRTLYAELQQEVLASGLMRRRYGHYLSRLVLAPLALAGVVATMVAIGDSWWQLPVAALLGLVLAQVSFLGHDAAHRQVFASGGRNEWTALLVVDLLSGVSHSWWTGKHTRHHGAPNQLGKDGDVESDVLAYHPDAAARRSRLGAWLTRRQGHYFFALLALEGWVLHTSSIRWLLTAPRVRRRRVELALLALRWGAYALLLLSLMSPLTAAAFLVVQLTVFGYYLGASFAPNHIGMPLVPERATVDFLRRQVLMSRNIRGGRAVDVLLGGLNHQIEHHLFPSMARPNLRRVRPVVREFCARHGITYIEVGLLRSYASVASYLNRVGLGARDVWVCPVAAQYRPVA